MALLLLSVLAAVGIHYATEALKGKIASALGPTADVREMIVGWSAIEIRGVRIRAPQGWPAAETLHAERIVVSPDLAGLFSGNVAIRRIDIDDAYVSILRTPDGRMKIMPGMLDSPASSHAAKPARAEGGVPVSIGALAFHGGAIEFFDASVRQPPQKIRIEGLHAELSDIHLPAMDRRMKIAIGGVIKGVARDGKVAIDGWLELAARNSSIASSIRGADLVLLEPYLVKAAETGVKKGALDLDLKSVVTANKLNAGGSVTLSGLELESTGGAASSFMGMPRALVISALKNRGDQINVPFTLTGDLNDPKFSLNASFYRQMAAVVASSLGLSLEGLVKGLAEPTTNLGKALKGLLGR